MRRTINRWFNLVIGCKISSIVHTFMEEQDEYEVEFVVDTPNKIRWMFEKKELDVLLAFFINTSELQQKYQHAMLKKIWDDAIWLIVFAKDQNANALVENMNETRAPNQVFHSKKPRQRD